MTYPLVTTSSGAKMGKTAAGAIWLDPELLSPYEFYQFWINTEDADVERFLAMFTFLPMERVRELGRLAGADIRQAKEVLAFEVTRILHGEAAAGEARETSRKLFGEGVVTEAVPTTELDAARAGGRHPGPRAVPAGGPLPLAERGPPPDRAGRRLRQRRAGRQRGRPGHELLTWPTAPSCCAPGKSATTGSSPE